MDQQDEAPKDPRKRSREENQQQQQNGGRDQPSQRFRIDLTASANQPRTSESTNSSTGFYLNNPGGGNSVATGQGFSLPQDQQWHLNAVDLRQQPKSHLNSSATSSQTISSHPQAQQQLLESLQSLLANQQDGNSSFVPTTAPQLSVQPQNTFAAQALLSLLQTSGQQQNQQGLPRNFTPSTPALPSQPPQQHSSLPSVQDLIAALASSRPQQDTQTTSSAPIHRISSEAPLPMPSIPQLQSNAFVDGLANMINMLAAQERQQQELQRQLALSAQQGLSPLQMQLLAVLLQQQQQQNQHPPAFASMMQQPQPQAPPQIISIPSFGIATSQSTPNKIQRKVKNLSQPNDCVMLSRYQVCIRRQLELFTADETDAQTIVQGRKRAVRVNQVGLRCRYCHHLPLSVRARGAVYYPKHIAGIYQAALNMASSHLLDACDSVPKNVRDEIRLLRDRHETRIGGKNYWHECCSGQGLEEREEALWFK